MSLYIDDIDERHEVYQKVPILEFNAEYVYGALDVPLIWTTKPIWDNFTTGTNDRNYLVCYAPDDVIYGADSVEDVGGIKALQFGGEYYNEGFSYQGTGEERNNRIDCFRAAEIFYLHSMQLGNIQALVNLGYIYAYDRCESYNWECFF